MRAKPRWWSTDTPLFASENGKQLSSEYWSKRFRKYCRQAGIEATPYFLRHTAAIKLLHGSADAFSVQRILGYSVLGMTKRYIKLAQEDVRESHEKTSPVGKLASMGKRAKHKL